MAASCALRILDAATICMARVICAVFPIDRMRRRRSRPLAMASGPALLELPGRGCERGGERVAQRLLGGDLRPQLALRRGPVLGVARLEFLHPLDRAIVEGFGLHP